MRNTRFQLEVLGEQYHTQNKSNLCHFLNTLLNHSAPFSFIYGIGIIMN
jgi:hypothetical protein